MAPVVILGGIYSGFFTPTEAAIVSIFYTLFVGIFIYKELKLKSIFKSMDSTTWLAGRVLIILFTAQAFRTPAGSIQNSGCHRRRSAGSYRERLHHLGAGYCFPYRYRHVYGNIGDHHAGYTGTFARDDVTGR